MKRVILTMFSMLFLFGCSTYSGQRYAMSVDNIEIIKSTIQSQPYNYVAVGDFTSTKPSVNNIMCRAVGPIKTPDGETFEAYIRDALIDELKMSNAYSESSSVVIKGNLDEIDFDSMNGIWTLRLTISFSNGSSFTVSESYAFTPSWYGETGCNQTAQAFMPAVQNLIRKVVSHSSFKTWIVAKS